jgi:hypothetical protein
MADEKHVELLKRAVGEWNSWREGSSDVPDLKAASAK